MHLNLSRFFKRLFLWEFLMKKLLLIFLTSSFLVGCATHTPAPTPTGTLFKINERPLVQPTIQPLPLNTELDNG